jgi:hypothetical protein
MIKRAFIHIGTPKTGTTSIQAFFAGNRNALMQKGIYYPEVFAKGSGRAAANHIKLAASCADYKRSKELCSSLGIDTEESWVTFHSKLSTLFDDELRALKNIPETLICSNEHLSVQVFEVEEMTRLKTLFSEWCEDIYIVVYLREQVDVTISSYIQKLKGGYSKDLVLADLPSRWKDYENLVNEWSNVFGRDRVIPRLFARDKLDNGDLISDFSNVVGLSAEALQHLDFPAPSNESISAEQCKVLLEFNRFVRNSSFSKNEVTSMRKCLVDHFRSTKSGSKLKVDNKEIKDFRKKYLESNRRLASRYFPDEENLFSNVDSSEF